MAREDDIRLIAYRIWEEESCPIGRDCEHWYRAEAIWEEENNKPAAKATGTRKQVKQASKSAATRKKS